MSPVEPSPPSGAGRPEWDALGQLLEHGKGLGEEVLAWAELRIQQERLLLSEEVDRRLHGLIAAACLAGLGLVAGGLVLVAACLGLGSWLGHPGWGFLAVGLALGGLGLALYWIRPRVLGRWFGPAGFDLARPRPVRVFSREALVEEQILSPQAPMGRPTEAPMVGSSSR